MNPLKTSHGPKRVLPAATIILFFALLILYGSYKQPEPGTKYATWSKTWDVTDQRVLHPLDPLTTSEFLRIQETLRNKKLLGREKQVLHSIELDDPEKHGVLQWETGNPIPARCAEVISSYDGVPHRIIVDVDNRVVRENTVISTTGYPPLTSDDWKMSMQLPATYQPFLDSIARYGLRLEEVTCLPLSPGWFGVPEEGNRRLAKLGGFVTTGTTNFYLRPIEGMIVIVDLNENKILKFIDGNKSPIPKNEGTDYRLSTQKPPFFPRINPISIEQPLGPSFTIDGHHVKWANWEFHVRPHLRVGSVISQAKVDGRSVLYQGFVSELYVPYQTAEEAWYFRTYLDAGEYGLGLLAHPLQPLNDCPQNAKYMDAVFAGPDGTPYTTPNMMCIFERYAGNIAWQHAESLSSDMELHEVRPKVSLVVRMIASVGNYDYIIDWEFQTDGVVRVEVGATGVVIVKGTPIETMKEKRMKEELDGMYGPLISENTIGVIHDHFLTFHMDLDVDGPSNSFVVGELVKHNVTTGESPRKSYWSIEKRVAKTEEDGRIKFSPDHPSQYYMKNPSRTTRLGNEVSYRIVPGSFIGSLMDPNDFPQLRAAFTNNQMWVTPYNRSEKYAGGFFPYQNHGDDGLAIWSRNRPVEDTDVVLWYTFGFHHVPCQEDFPIMPTVTASFEIKPTNFFESNPILKLQPN